MPTIAVLSHSGAELDAAITKVETDYADVSGVTATAADVLTGKKFVGADKTLTDGTLVVPTPPAHTVTIHFTGTSDMSYSNAMFTLYYYDTITQKDVSLGGFCCVDGSSGPIEVEQTFVWEWVDGCDFAWGLYDDHGSHSVKLNNVDITGTSDYGVSQNIPADSVIDITYSYED